MPTWQRVTPAARLGKVTVRIYLENVAKRTVIAAVGFAKCLVDHDQYIKDVHVTIGLAVGVAWRITAVRGHTVRYVCVLKLAMCSNLETQDDIDCFEDIKEVYHAVATCLLITAWSADTILRIDVATGLETDFDRVLRRCRGLR